MKYQITLTKRALKEFEYFKKHNEEIFRKIITLLKIIENDPLDKGSKTELLKFELSGCRSKRITKEHRLVYKIEGHNIIIFSCRYHY
jgi:toxin YoeB